MIDTAINLPIDPFSTSYWSTETTTKSTMKPATDTTMPAPARTPLIPIKGSNAQFFPNLQAPSVKAEPTTKSGKAIAAAKPLPLDLLPKFKTAVHGSNLSKIGLVEVLKKEFPEVTKKTIEQTLLQVARRDGKKEAEKVWHLIEP